MPIMCKVSKYFTILWGLVAIAFALFAHMVENLIEAVNIVGSIFYGVMLGIFLVAFFLKRIGGTAIFWAAIVAQLMIFVLYYLLQTGYLKIAYLWFNPIGCALCMVIALIFQAAQGRNSQNAEAKTIS